MGEVIVRLDMDHALKNTPFLSRQKLTDIWYYMLGRCCRRGTTRCTYR